MSKLDLDKICSNSKYDWKNVSTKQDGNTYATYKYTADKTHEADGFKDTNFTISYYRHDFINKVYLGYMIEHNILGVVYKGGFEDGHISLDIIMDSIVHMLYREY